MSVPAVKLIYDLWGQYLVLIAVVTSDYVKIEEKEDLFFMVRLVLR